MGPGVTSRSMWLLAMDASLSKCFPLGIIFIALIASDYWLSHADKPYNVILFNAHKLIALGGGVLLIVTAVNAHRVAPLQSAPIVALVVTGILFVLTAAAGGLVSVLATGGLAGMPVALKMAVSLAHQVLPYPAVLATAASLYLLLHR